MPIPSQTAFDRISRSVNYTEGARRNRDTVESPLVPNNRDLRWVSLNGDVYSSTTATGYLCNWSVTGSAYSVSSNQVTVVDTAKRFYGLKNQWVLCRGNYQSSSPYGIYEIVWAPNVFNFELQGDLAPGGYAQAYPLNASGAADTTHATIPVYDSPEGNRRALGSTTMSASHGARGKAHWNTDLTSVKWEIVECQQQAQLIMVACPSSSTPSIGASTSIANTYFTSGNVTGAPGVTVLDRGQDPSNGTGVISGIVNYTSPIQAAGGNVSGIICTWNETAGLWYVIDGPC